MGENKKKPKKTRNKPETWATESGREKKREKKRKQEERQKKTSLPQAEKVVLVSMSGLLSPATES